MTMTTMILKTMGNITKSEYEHTKIDYRQLTPIFAVTEIMF